MPTDPPAAPELRFDFYPCRVDDAPASIMVGFHFEHRERPARCDHLHVAVIEMKDGADHGMGSRTEAERLWDAEDSLDTALAESGLVHVGRLRNRGSWQISYYGPASESDAFQQAVDELGKKIEREVWTHIKSDADWSYFETFLLPDEERRRWMADNSVVERLIEEGDPLTKPRLVDHEFDFRMLRSIDAFLEAANSRGFATTRVADEPDDDNRWLVSIQREDPVTLEHIHEVVEELVELAKRHHGEHTGWGCTAEADD